MPTAPKQIEADINSITKGWEELAADKSFGGMTLAQYKAKVKASLDARGTIRSLDTQMTAAIDARDDADGESSKANQLVVNGVKGDPAFGEDSDLYEAMGYVRKSERKSGLTRKKSTPPAK
jgi:hypothetical protein